MLDQLEAQLRASMTEVYGPTQIPNGNEEVDRQLAGVTDSDRQDGRTRRHDEIHGFCTRYCSTRRAWKPLDLRIMAWVHCVHDMCSPARAVGNSK